MQLQVRPEVACIAVTLGLGIDGCDPSMYVSQLPCCKLPSYDCRVLHLALAGLGCWQRLPQAVGNWFRCTRYQLQLGHALRYRSFIHVCFLASGFMPPQLSLTSCTSASLIC